MNLYHHKLLFLGLVALLFSTMESCRKEPPPVVPTSEIVAYDPTPYLLEPGELPPPQIAADNQLTVQGVKLGRMLFYEPLLSKDGSQSCSSCHLQSQAFSDTTTFSIGVDGLPGKRQAMAVFNMAWNNNEFFWDGRAHLLRDQSLLPIQDPLEMDESLANVIGKLEASSNYRDQFKRTFDSEVITEEKISLALEQFMNSIVSNRSKYDRYLAGTANLTANEERGRELFFAEYNPGFPMISGADCAHCHSGKNFENDRYMNNGLDDDSQFTDHGREDATANQNDRAKFKVPSLRNVEVTPPYMHDGRFRTLEEVVDHYNSGMRMSATVDPALIYPINNGGLQLSQQDKDDLVAFLKTLTDHQLLSNPKYSDPF